MPKYRDWDTEEDNRRNTRKDQRRRGHEMDPLDYWDRKTENRNKWNKKHPHRR